MDGFCLYRILGNELPPRDEPGSRLSILRFILSHEPPLPRCERRWLLNTFHDPAWRTAAHELLDQHGCAVEELPFDPEAFRAARSTGERLCAAINLNGARNHALRAGRKRQRFTLVLDGDCTFTAPAWRAVVDGIDQDQRRRPGRRYYSVPMRRVAITQALDEAAAGRPDEEPQLVFRDDAELAFDPRRPYGKDSKNELLWLLGHRPGSYALAPGAVCASVGHVIHLAPTLSPAERELTARLRAREQALAQLFERVRASLGLSGDR